MKNQELIDYLKLKEIPYETDVDLKKKTWIHRGGNAGVFVIPSNSEELELVCCYLYSNNIQFLLIGHSSNLYIHNEVDFDVVVSTSKCNAFHINDDVIECECGAAVSKIAKASVESGLQGMEYLTVLPGTVGAGLYNNSSCRDSSISSLLIDAVFLDSTGCKRTLLPSDFSFEYRSSSLKKKQIHGVLLKIRLRLVKGDKKSLSKIANDNEKRRHKTLEGPAQNLGCTVNRTFSKGEMPRKYEVALKTYTKIVSLFVPKEKQKVKLKNFILRISGYKDLSPYISDKQMITFIWRDEKADKLFPRYLEFMSSVYGTDSIEIEEIKNRLDGED